MMSSRGWIVSCVLVVLLAVPAVIPTIIRAQETPTPTSSAPAFLLEPVDQPGSYFDLTLEPGDKKTFKVALGNAGEAPVSALTYVADVYTLVNGGFGVNTDDEPKTGTTTWLDYPSETVELEPERKIERTFTITVPEETAPGQYITGLVLQTAEPIAIGSGGMLQQNIVKSIAVFITVPGPVSAKLTIGQASLKQTSASNSLLIEVKNEGNVLLKPTGTVTMSNEGGDVLLTAPVAMGSVYAGMATTLELPIPTTLAPGSYVVAVTLEDEETDAKAEAPDLALTVTELSASATPVVAPITIDAVSVEPFTDPNTNLLQVVNVAVTLVNTGAPVPSARLTLRVLRDGELVEDFPLNSSLVVPSGTTEIQQRYAPLGGWAAGTYTFTVTLEAVDATSGQATVLATADVATTVVVP